MLADELAHVREARHCEGMTMFSYKTCWNHTKPFFIVFVGRQSSCCFGMMIGYDRMTCSGHLASSLRDAEFLHTCKA